MDALLVSGTDWMVLSPAIYFSLNSDHFSSVLVSTFLCSGGNALPSAAPIVGDGPSAPPHQQPRKCHPRGFST